jgi:hypothetical protein
MSFIEDNLDDDLDYFSKYDRKTSNNKEMASTPKILEFFCSSGKLLPKSIKNKLRRSPWTNVNSFPTTATEEIYQQKYIKAFLMIYFGYLNEVILNNLSKKFSFEENRKIGYIFNIEKRLLDEVFRSKEELNEILIASGIVKQGDESRKARIFTHGEGLLPALQHRLHIDLPLKSYYVQAQLLEDYIQVSLNQVVKVASSKEEEASAIVIQNNTIPIENIYDSMCRNIWTSYVESNDGSNINRCELHEQYNYDEGIVQIKETLYSLDDYENFLAKLKQHFHEMVSAKIIYEL